MGHGRTRRRVDVRALVQLGERDIYLDCRGELGVNWTEYVWNRSLVVSYRKRVSNQLVSWENTSRPMLSRWSRSELVEWRNFRS